MIKKKIFEHFRTLSNRRGQSLVEFAVSITVMLILIAGVVDGGRALFTYMALRDAAQEGALFGSAYPSKVTLIKERAFYSSEYINGLWQARQDIDPNDKEDPCIPDGSDPKKPVLCVNVNYSGGVCAGNGITVQVLYQNFPLTMPFLGAILGSQMIPIRASITDTILVPSCN